MSEQTDSKLEHLELNSSLEPILEDVSRRFTLLRRDPELTGRFISVDAMGTCQERVIESLKLHRKTEWRRQLITDYVLLVFNPDIQQRQLHTGTIKEINGRRVELGLNLLKEVRAKDKQTLKNILNGIRSPETLEVIKKFPQAIAKEKGSKLFKTWLSALGELGKEESADVNQGLSAEDKNYMWMYWATTFFLTRNYSGGVVEFGSDQIAVALTKAAKWAKEAYQLPHNIVDIARVLLEADVTLTPVASRLAVYIGRETPIIYQMEEEEIRRAPQDRQKTKRVEYMRFLDGISWQLARPSLIKLWGEDIISGIETEPEKILEGWERVPKGPRDIFSIFYSPENYPQSKVISEAIDFVEDIAKSTKSDVRYFLLDVAGKLSPMAVVVRSFSPEAQPEHLTSLVELYDLSGYVAYRPFKTCVCKDIALINFRGQVESLTSAVHLKVQKISVQNDPHGNGEYNSHTHELFFPVIDSPENLLMAMHEISEATLSSQDKPIDDAYVVSQNKVRKRISGEDIQLTHTEYDYILRLLDREKDCWELALTRMSDLESKDFDVHYGVDKSTMVEYANTNIRKYAERYGSLLPKFSVEDYLVKIV